MNTPSPSDGVGLGEDMAVSRDLGLASSGVRDGDGRYVFTPLPPPRPDLPERIAPASTPLLPDGRPTCFSCSDGRTPAFWMAHITRTDGELWPVPTCHGHRDLAMCAGFFPIEPLEAEDVAIADTSARTVPARDALDNLPTTGEKTDLPPPVIGSLDDA